MNVSVIITNYNYGRFLPDAVNSVLAQTYSPVEIILVDDGSTDDSPAVMAELQRRSPEQIKTIVQPNQGQGAAFNAGFAAATGDVIAFLDADDIWKPNKIECIVAEFQQADVVGVMHVMEVVDGEGTVIEPSTVGVDIPQHNLAQLLLDTGGAWHFPPTSGLTYHRRVLEQILPTDAAQWRLHADGCLVFCSAFFGKVVLLNRVLASYRLHGHNYHASVLKPSESLQQQWLGSIERTNRWLNQFLAQQGREVGIDLARNLDYRRSRYYLGRQWNLDEATAISRLILTWPFYNTWERVKFLTRFWLKSARFLLPT